MLFSRAVSRAGAAMMRAPALRTLCDSPKSISDADLAFNLRSGSDNIDLDAASKEAVYDPHLTTIMANNKKWVENQVQNDPEFFRRLNDPQAPKYLWVGCSDARIPADSLTGTRPGQMFVHRNLANLVVNTDLNFMSVLQYAVNVLEVPHIIVCGHYDCGGVRAACTNEDRGLMEHWFKNIRDVYRLHFDELNRIRDPEARHRRLVELNVIEQCLNLYKTGIVQRKRMATKNSHHYQFSMPRVHGVVFDPVDGVLHNLHIHNHYKETIHKYGSIYTMRYNGSTAEPSPFDPMNMSLTDPV